MWNVVTLSQEIGPEDSTKTVTTQFCLFHFFEFLPYGKKSIEVLDIVPINNVHKMEETWFGVSRMRTLSKDG